MKVSDKLRAYWSKKESDIMLYHPLGMSTSSDASYLSSLFDKNFIEEMIRRGYNLETMKFSIEPKIGNGRFASQRESNKND